MAAATPAPSHAAATAFPLAPSPSAAAASPITLLELPQETPLGQPADYLDEVLECLARDDGGRITDALDLSPEPITGHLCRTIGDTDVGVSAALVPMPSSMALRDLLS